MTGNADSAHLSGPARRRISAVKHYRGKNSGQLPERGRSYGFAHGLLAAPEATVRAVDEAAAL